MNCGSDRRSCRPWAGLAVLLAACSSAPPLPEAAGQGLIARDDAPPAGAETFERPRWMNGDRLTFVMGGLARDVFTVEATGEGYRQVHEASGRATLRNLDLWDLGAETLDSAEPQVVYDPADPRFDWPLWVGKTWTAHYVQKQPGQATPIIVSYAVEGIDTLEVPAGSFRTLRILRSMRPATGEPIFPDQSLHWYAPEIGYEVRWLRRGQMIELVEFERPPAGGAQGR